MNWDCITRGETFKNGDPLSMNMTQTSFYEADAIYHHHEDAVFHVETIIAKCIMTQA